MKLTLLALLASASIALADQTNIVTIYVTNTITVYQTNYNNPEEITITTNMIEWVPVDIGIPPTPYVPNTPN